MTHEFHVGQKVVCVNAVPRQNHGDWPLIDRAIYTVRGLVSDHDGTPGLLLDEVPPPPGWNDWAFASRRFRPLEFKSTEIFRRIAQGVSHGTPIIEDAEYRMPTPEKVSCCDHVTEMLAILGQIGGYAG